MRLKSAFCCFAATMAIAAPANAATINLIDTGGVTGSAAEQGFKIAAAYWGSVLSNNVTINLQVGYSALGTGIIGSTGSTSEVTTVTNVLNALNANTNKSALDSTAVLPTTTNGAIKMITSGYASANGTRGVNTATKVWDTDTTGTNSNNNKNLDVNTANLKALGISTAATVDGSVTFSTAFNFDFDPTDGITAGSMDFIGVAIHEIGHALGFVSGVDTYDIVGGPNGPLYNSYRTVNVQQYAILSTLDLFRYSSDPTNIAPGAGPALDVSVGTASYFSIDGGANQLFGNSLFSTGYYNGDGRQASHWKDAAGCSGQIGIMDPTFCYAQMGEVTALDLAAMDAIGWNISFDVLANSGYKITSADIYNRFAAVPEPATWALLIAGFGMVGGAMRRRRTTVIFA